MNCPFCGNSVNVNASVCGSCGARNGYVANGQFFYSKDDLKRALRSYDFAAWFMLICGIGFAMTGVGVGVIFGSLFAVGGIAVLIDNTRKMKQERLWYRK